MTRYAAAQDEAGPSSGSPRCDNGVRRCKTVSFPASSPSRPSQPITSAIASSTMLKGLALPLDLDRQTSEKRDAVSELRDPFVSPSKRGETLRAHSRQRRVFSGNAEPSSTSSEQFTRLLPPASPLSVSERRSYPGRDSINLNGTSEPTGFSLLFPHSAVQEADAVGIDGASARSRHMTLGDELVSSLSSTPSLTSPTSTLSRSTSLRSAASERANLMGATRYISLNASADLGNTVENLSPDQTVSDWTTRARRWSNSVSRTMSISALNQTIHSTTSPYLKAGLQELRSIFDVDTLGAAADDHPRGDLEGASPSQRRSYLDTDEHSRLALFGSADAAGDVAAAAAAFSRDQAVFESPEATSPVLSRQHSCRNRQPVVPVEASRPGLSFQSQVYAPPVTHRRAQSWRKHRSLSISNLPNRSLLAPIPKAERTSDVQSSGSSELTGFYSTRDRTMRSSTVRTPLVAVALAALSVIIIGVCVFETTVHPDAASLPLTAFMLAQSLFALVGISGLALQKRWLIDLASRVIRAHVLCQVLIALAALRSLSRTAFYRDRLERPRLGETAAIGMLSSPPFFAASQQAADPHLSSVGSFHDQVTYVCVFVVQAALPLALALWAQYAVASALSRAARSLPSCCNANKQYSQQDQRQQLLAPIVKVADANVDSGATTDACFDPCKGRVRFNSENPTCSKGSSRNALGVTAQRSEGWLGFTITRLDADQATKAQPKFELDVAELTSRLEGLAAANAPTPLQRETST